MSEHFEVQQVCCLGDGDVCDGLACACGHGCEYHAATSLTCECICGDCDAYRPGEQYVAELPVCRCDDCRTPPEPYPPPVKSQPKVTRRVAHLVTWP